MIGQLLAETAGFDGVTISVAAITAIGGVWALLVKAHRNGIAKGEAKRDVTISDQPVGVRLHEAWVTRQEFLEFKGEIKADVREMRGTFEKLATIIDERDRKLTDMIEKVASGAYEGRRRIHEQVNAHGAQLAVLAAKTDISKGLGSLGAAITKAIKSTEH